MEQLSETFYALTDPTRRSMLERLSARELSAGELARPYRVSLPAISKHLRVLERAGLVHRHIEGRVHRFRVDPRNTRKAMEWLKKYQRFWESQFDALEKYMTELMESEKKKEKENG